MLSLFGELLQQKYRVSAPSGTKDYQRVRIRKLIVILNGPPSAGTKKFRAAVNRLFAELQRCVKKQTVEEGTTVRNLLVRETTLNNLLKEKGVKRVIASLNPTLPELD